MVIPVLPEAGRSCQYFSAASDSGHSKKPGRHRHDEQTYLTFSYFINGIDGRFFGGENKVIVLKPVWRQHKCSSGCIPGRLQLLVDEGKYPDTHLGTNSPCCRALQIGTCHYTAKIRPRSLSPEVIILQ